MRFRIPVLIVMATLATTACSSPSVDRAVKSPPPALSSDTARLEADAAALRDAGLPM